jgi:hypothetical protein
MLEAQLDSMQRRLPHFAADSAAAVDSAVDAGKF